mgnify:CR=1 FL=1
MLRGVKLTGEIKPVDPNRGIAEAITEAARRTDASNKALIDAVRSIITKAPEVQVVHHETVQATQAVAKRPAKWTFTVERDEQGLMTSITAVAG